MCKSIERKYIKIEDLDNSEFCKSCKIAYKIIETADYLIKGQEPDKRIFNLLGETLDKLNDYSVHYSLI